jgi:hypothetical protein
LLALLAEKQKESKTMTSEMRAEFEKHIASLNIETCADETYADYMYNQFCIAEHQQNEIEKRYMQSTTLKTALSMLTNF